MTNKQKNPRWYNVKYNLSINKHKGFDQEDENQQSVKIT